MPAPPKRLLLVEDDHVIRRMIAAVLTRKGFSVFHETQSDRAIERLAGEEFDAVLLDLMILPAGGNSVLGWMEAERPELLRRTLVVSAATPQVVEQTVAGRCGALLKPFDIDVLAAEVASRTSLLNPG